MTGSLCVLDLGLVFLGFLIIRRLLRPRLSVPLPPGPRQWPLLGNLLAMPSSKEWLTFASWGEKWGRCTILSGFVSLSQQTQVTLCPFASSVSG